MQNDIRVRLPDIRGTVPETYLVYLYSGLVFTLLFMLLVFPGLIRPGSRISFISDIRQGELFIDSELAGSVPGEYYLSPGVHDIELRAPAFAPGTLNYRVRPRILLTLFIPSRAKVSFDLSLADETAALSLRRSVMRSLALWSFVAPDSAHQVPPFFDNFAVDLLAAGAQAASESAAGSYPPPEIAGNSQIFRDLLRGSIRLRSGSPAATPAGLTSVLSYGLKMAAEHPRLLTQLGDILPATVNRDALDGLITYSGTEKTGVEDASALRPTAGGRLASALEALGYSGELLSDDKGYVILKSPVSYEMYLRFAEEDDLWATDNYYRLMDAGLARGSYYLHAPDGSSLSDTDGIDAAARGVPPAAALAFCSWLEGQPGFEGYRVRLPLPDELFRAHDRLSYAVSPDSEGRLWEMTSALATAYPAPGGFTPKDLRLSDFDSAMMGELGAGILDVQSSELMERFLRNLLDGAISLVNSDERRGFLPLLTASPVTGFRLVIEPR